LFGGFVGNNPSSNDHFLEEAEAMNATAIIAALRSEVLPLPAVLWALLCVAHPASAQSPLSLSDALARAHARSPDTIAAAAAEREAAERVTQARGGYLPRVDVVESWQRGNQPAFVFSSLLAQRSVAMTDLSVAALNTRTLSTTSDRRSPLSSRCSMAAPRRVFEPRQSGGTWRPSVGASSIRT
jgi:hypothetical protein